MDANLSEANYWGLSELCRNGDGNVLATTTWKTTGMSDPAAAEAYGLYLATKFAADCGFMDVTFESDCETNIRTLNGEGDIPNTYVGNVIRGIMCRAMKFRHVAFRHVDRKGNKAAHRLAQQAIREPNVIWLKETPPCITSEVLRDLLH